MAARVAQVEGQKSDPSITSLMHAMGPNVAALSGLPSSPAISSPSWDDRTDPRSRQPPGFLKRHPEKTGLRAVSHKCERRGNALSLLAVLCVPVDVARHEHYDAEQEKQSQGADQERVVLQAEDHEQEGIDQDEAGRDQRPPGRSGGFCRCRARSVWPARRRSSTRSRTRSLGQGQEPEIEQA